MALNYVFIFFILSSFLIALARTIGYIFRHQFEGWGIVFDQSDAQVFSDLVASSFSTAEASVSIVIGLIGIMTLWLGIMNIGKEGGMIEKLSHAVSPFFTRLFPAIPKDHPAIGSMMMNFSANMLGLDNAATPLGLQAMKDLQSLNPKKDTASDSMIMFLALNTSGLTIIPISVMGLLASLNDTSPSAVFIPILLTTACATLAVLFFVAIKQKINMFQVQILVPIVALCASIGLIVALISATASSDNFYISMVGNGLLVFIIALIVWQGVRTKINVYDAFIDGAKEGFNTSIKIIPYLVGILFAIGFFRACGALDIINNAVTWLLQAVYLPTDFVDALPTAWMKPLSGSGARGMMVDTIKLHGAESFPGRVAALFQGSTETTFYTLAVYYGAINIKNTRYTVQAGLFADIVGIIAAIVFGYLFFGDLIGR